jgi:anti-sigma B factor antagonist
VGPSGNARPSPANPYTNCRPGNSLQSRLVRAALPPSAAEHLWITGYEHELGAVVAVAGELDLAGGPPLAEYLGKLGADLQVRVVLDLTNLDFCDCAGLSVLLRAHRGYVADGGWLRLSGLKPAIHRILRITKLTRLLVCYPDIAAAFHDGAMPITPEGGRSLPLPGSQPLSGPSARVDGDGPGLWSGHDTDDAAEATSPGFPDGRP